MWGLLLISLVLTVAGSGLKDASMNPKVVKQDGFTVIGISARTSNEKEMTAQGVIGPMWGRLYKENVLEKIPNKADSKIVAVYTDYAMITTESTRTCSGHE